MENKIKTCSFFGHRDTKLKRAEEDSLRNLIVDLIVKDNTKVFLFGSRSKFDYACLEIVSELKKTYPNIQRVVYTCKNEMGMLESEKKFWEKIYFNINKSEEKLLYVDKEVEHKNKYTAGKASYIERNYAMIDESDICVFFFNKNYIPKRKKGFAKSINNSKPNSGTSLAYKYATRKRKDKKQVQVFNIFKEE